MQQNIRSMLLVLIFMAGTGCNLVRMQDQAEFESLATGFAYLYNVSEIESENFIDLQSTKPPLLLIDVRESVEQNVSIIPYAIMSHPDASLNDLPELHKFLKTNRNNHSAQIIVYCAGGYRSARSIANLMKRAVRTDSELTEFQENSAEVQSMAGRDSPDRLAGIPIFNLHGGIIAYANAGGTLVQKTSMKKANTVHAYNAYWSSFVKQPTNAVIEPAVD